MSKCDTLAHTVGVKHQRTTSSDVVSCFQNGSVGSNIANDLQRSFIDVSRYL